MKDEQAGARSGYDERRTKKRTHARILYFTASALALIFFVFAIIFFSSSRGGPQLGEQRRLEGGLRAGSPEFERHRKAIIIDSLERNKTRVIVTDRAVDLTTTIRNQTGRTINGLEMRGALIGNDGTPLGERIVLPVPDQQAQLEPGEAMDVHIILPRIAKTDANDSDVLIEVTAVRFE